MSRLRASVRPVSAHRAALALALAAAGCATTPAPSHQPSTANTARIEALRAKVTGYEQAVAVLEAQEAIENLQGKFGYYLDKGLWREAAALFSRHATFEWGQRGVYVGPERIRQALGLFGGQGLAAGQLNINMQLQPYVSVAPDALTAKARWRAIQQLVTPEGEGRWGAGVYENEYVLEDGAWKISRLHYYVTLTADYDRGWIAGVLPMEGASATLPPDTPPTEVYRSLPGAYLPPYHFLNPVTGRSGTLP